MAVADKRQVKHDSIGDFVWETVLGYKFDDPIPYGHGEKSVYIISSFIKLTREEAMAIRWHMGPYDEAAGSYAYKDARRYAKFRWPMVIALHDADMTATQKEQREEKGGGAGNEKDA